MTNHEIPLRDADDPIPGVVAPWMPEWLHRLLPERLNRDEVRVPLSWSAEPGAGFTEPGVTPWLPFHPDHVRVNVEAERHDPGSLLAWYRRLLELRRSSPALQEGTLELFDTDPDVVAFDRAHGDERRAVVANLGERTVTHPVNGAEPAATSDPAVRLTATSVTLPPHTAAVLRLP